MSIWSYENVVRSKKALKELGRNIYRCMFCGNDMYSFPMGRPNSLCVCNTCGWWVVDYHKSWNDEEYLADWHSETYRTAGQLKEFDPSNIEIPIHELERYLLARREEVFNIHPKRLEDIVGGIFSDFGYRVRVTSYGGDEGIDIFALDGTSSDLVGVQVKRHKNKIEAEQIRAFIGALVLKGITRGVYVTTSSYRSGAKEASATSSKLGLPLELWDGARLLDQLEVKQRSVYTGADDEDAPFYGFLGSETPLTLIWHDGGTAE